MLLEHWTLLSYLSLSFHPQISSPFYNWTVALSLFSALSPESDLPNSPECVKIFLLPKSFLLEMHSVTRRWDHCWLPHCIYRSCSLDRLLVWEEQISAQCLQSTFTYMIPWMRYHIHFIDVGPEAQRGWLNHPKPHSQISVGGESVPRPEHLERWLMSSHTDRMPAVWSFRGLRPCGFWCNGLTCNHPAGLGSSHSSLSWACILQELGCQFPPYASLFLPPFAGWLLLILGSMYRAGYRIRRAQYKMTMLALCSKVIKNFKTATAEH